MRGLKQLGPTEIVYPGAVHTRFMHSIGTMYVAEKIVKVCNRNAEEFENKNLLHIDDYPRLLIRLSALLHDLAHIPYGHTLENEGKLFPSEWKDENRPSAKIFENGSIMDERIKEVILDFDGSDELGGRILKDLKAVIIEEDSDFDHPYVKDIVSNTLCADLLDYSERDMFFCGLPERVGDRFLNYFAILPLEETEPETPRADFKIYKLCPEENGGKGRLVLLGYRYEYDRKRPQKGRMNAVLKPDVFSEAIDLLRKRYSLAEKVYFHRTKIAASSMLISAINDLGLSSKDLFEKSDGEVISILSHDSDNHPRAANIVKSYKRRNLYKPIYKVKYIKENEDDPVSLELWKKLYPVYRDHPEERKEMEEKLEEIMEFESGSISIYCPDRNMNLKLFKAMIRTGPDNDVRFLRNIQDTIRSREIHEIESIFEVLWNFYVFVDPYACDPQNLNDPAVQELSHLCENEFGLPNDILNLRLLGRSSTEIYSKRLARDWDSKHPDMPVTCQIMEDILSSPQRHQSKEISEKEYMQKRLQDNTTKFYKKE